MRRLLTALSALVLIASSISARADSFVTLQLVGTLTTGAFLPGSDLTIDTTTGKITAADFTIKYLGVDFVFDKAPVLQGSAFGNYYALFDGTSLSDTFLLDLAGYKSLKGYGGGLVMTDSVFDPNIYAWKPIQDKVNHASIVPTPEPSSLLLLGTGILGLAGAVRHRLKR